MARAGTGTGTGIMADQQGKGLFGGIGGAIGGVENKAQEEMAMNMIMGVLRSLNYPQTKASLTQEAQKRGAPGQVMDVLNRMPERSYASADDVAGEAKKAWKSWSPGPGGRHRCATPSPFTETFLPIVPFRPIGPWIAGRVRREWRTERVAARPSTLTSW